MKKIEKIILYSKYIKHNYFLTVDRLNNHWHLVVPLFNLALKSLRKSFSWSRGAYNTI